MEPRTDTTVATLNDPLGEALHLLRLTGTLYCRSELNAPWGIDMPAFEDHMMFHVVTAGQCWLNVPGQAPVLLPQGSLALVPHGKGHSIRSSVDSEVVPLFDLPVDRISDRYEVMRYGGSGETTQLTCGVVRFDHVAGQRLLDCLPPVLHIDAWSAGDDSWLKSTMGLIAREAGEMRPGGETVITRLADILIIQAIRAWIDLQPDTGQGWLAALRDRQIGLALAAMHREPQNDWSVDSLAGEARMSRSGFSARFSELVGESVKAYLTRWRMQLARLQLLQGDESMAVLATRYGYQSEAAFSRAFKRIFGVAPGSVRQARRKGGG